VTYPYLPQPAPRPGPPPGDFGPDPRTPQLAQAEQPEAPAVVDGTGHPAVDAVLQSLANAARLAPADQIAEYEAAHRVLQETLASIDG
jgi:NADPH-dependent curcumin reductase CurA